MTDVYQVGKRSEVRGSWEILVTRPNGSQTVVGHWGRVGWQDSQCRTYVGGEEAEGEKKHLCIRHRE